MAATGFRGLWEHPSGLKTVFFWAPTMKWGIVLASLLDMRRPAENVSIPQCSALALTAVVWTRWRLAISPAELTINAVDPCIALTNMYQLFRIAKASRNKSEPEDVPSGKEN